MPNGMLRQESSLILHLTVLFEAPFRRSPLRQIIGPSRLRGSAIADNDPTPVILVSLPAARFQTCCFKLLAIGEVGG